MTVTEFRPKESPGSSLKVKVSSRVSPDFTLLRLPVTSTVGLTVSMPNAVPSTAVELPAASVTVMRAL